MVCYDNLKLLEDYEVDRAYALTCRKKYLTMRLWQIEDEIEAEIEGCLDDDWAIAFMIHGLRVLALERRDAHRELKAIDKLMLNRPDGNEITDEMIETARQYPVDRLVEFIRGSAKAWCHDDRRPSMYHGTRRNRAVCPVCNKRFNPIDILMDRDGYSFAEAVKALQ